MPSTVLAARSIEGSYYWGFQDGREKLLAISEGGHYFCQPFPQSQECYPDVSTVRDASEHIANSFFEPLTAHCGGLFFKISFSPNFPFLQLVVIPAGPLGGHEVDWYDILIADKCGLRSCSLRLANYLWLIIQRASRK